jgi:membrane peptidoglycan carboxypeptidase
MRKAIVAVEDRRFYENSSIDYIEDHPSGKSDVSSGGFTQGASTIEQQLVRKPPPTTNPPATTTTQPPTTTTTGP